MQKSADSIYLRLEQEVGKDIALFCMCAVYDVAYDDSIEFESFGQYKIRKKDTFLNGETDIREVLKSDETERWINEWGVGNESKPRSEQDYHRLDQLFKTYSSRLIGAGGMDVQTEDTLRNVCVMRLEADKALAKGGKDNINIASTLNKMIQENLSSEQLRKKDAKPIETARIDGIVEAVAKKWGVDVNLTYDEAIAACSKWLVSHHYPITMDAAEQMKLSIINTMRANDDLPEMTELPVPLRFSEGHATEFETVPNATEREVYEYLGIKRGSPYGG